MRRAVKTAQQRTINSNTVTGILAVDGWAATFGTARRGLGGLWPRQVSSSRYQMQQRTHGRPVYTKFILFDVALYFTCAL